MHTYINTQTKVPFTRYNLLSNWSSNQFDNRVNVCIHDTTSCQTGYQTGLTTGYYRVYSRLSNWLYNPV